MKVIFLDIDGVLNSDQYMSSESYKLECEQAGITNHLSYDVVSKAHHLHIDPNAISLLNNLIANTGAQVILSSTWRLRYNIQEMNALLKMRGALFEILTYTPTTRSCRDYEVKSLLLSIKGIDKFVIFDDLEIFPSFPNEYIHISVKVGLTEIDISKALTILQS